ncbi:MAG: peroxiredoxin [Candidatus Methanoperedens sp.]|nr:peroxiredoxin [Candidatus Methanoperedens sp.]
MGTVRVKEKAHDFKLEDQNGKEIHLSDLKGRKVLLSFHPLAWTRVCAEQMKSLEDNHGRFEDLNTVALGISVDTVPSKRAWAESLGIRNTSLLSDFWPHGKVAKLYGIFDKKEGVSERANIILDEDQQVIFVKVYPGAQLPDIEEIITALGERKI